MKPQARKNPFFYLHPQRHDERGVGIVELAIYLPVFFLIASSLFDLVGIVKQHIVLSQVVDNAYRKGTSLIDFDEPKTTIKNISLKSVAIPKSIAGTTAALEHEVLSSLKNSNLQLTDGKIEVQYGVRLAAGGEESPVTKQLIETPPVSSNRELYVTVAGEYNGILFQQFPIHVSGIGPVQ